MHVRKTSLEGVLLLEPVSHEDGRGFFMETWHQRKYREAGVDRSFVQDNLSYSVRNTLRGLHYQLHHPQAKLVYVVEGDIFDVAVDIRVGSPGFGRWVGVRLSGGNRRQVFVPEGFAHGFCVVSESALVVYKCTDFYDRRDEGGILWSDPGIGIEWPVPDPLLSAKDAGFPRLAELAAERLPVYPSL